MKIEILITLLCTSLMLVTPFSVVARENKISSNLSEQPDIEELGAQIRVVIDEVLQKYGHIPIVKGLCNMILNTLDLLESIIICIFLFILLIPVVLLLIVSYYLGLVYLLYYVNQYFFIIAVTMDDYCPNLIFKQPLRTLSILKDMDNITNLVKDCPCLQE